MCTRLQRKIFDHCPNAICQIRQRLLWHSLSWFPKLEAKHREIKVPINLKYSKFKIIIVLLYGERRNEDVIVDPTYKLGWAPLYRVKNSNQVSLL